MYATNTQIKARNIEPGMVIDIYDNERFPVEQVIVEWGAVQIHNYTGWRGLGMDETVTVAGYFNL